MKLWLGSEILACNLRFRLGTVNNILGVWNLYVTNSKTLGVNLDLAPNFLLKRQFPDATQQQGRVFLPTEHTTRTCCSLLRLGPHLGIFESFHCSRCGLQLATTNYVFHTFSKQLWTTLVQSGTTLVQSGWFGLIVPYFFVEVTKMSAHFFASDCECELHSFKLK